MKVTSQESPLFALNSCQLLPSPTGHLFLYSIGGGTQDRQNVIRWWG